MHRRNMQKTSTSERRSDSADLLVGLGSPHGDDQVGWRLVQLVCQHPSLAVQARALSDPVDLLEQLQGIQRLVIVDACKSGEKPGVITRWNGLDVRLASEKLASSHRIGLKDTLLLAQALGRLPEYVVVYGVEALRCEPQHEISSAVLAALPELARCVCSEFPAAAQLKIEFN